MIGPPFSGGALFTEAADGDMRDDIDARRRISMDCKIPDQWATARQRHGTAVLQVETAGEAGDGDALWTVKPGVPVAVFTADCFGVVLKASGATGVAHAGWRGVVAGVVAELRQEMTQAGYPPEKAAIGPGIGACCFEVGQEVASRFPSDKSATTWGTLSVDLTSAIESQLDGVDTWVADKCTRHDERWFSHRRDGTPLRQATIGWM